MPLALNFPGVTFARAGVYTFRVIVGGEQIYSLNFSVNASQRGFDTRKCQTLLRQ